MSRLPEIEYNIPIPATTCGIGAKPHPLYSKMEIGDSFVMIRSKITGFRGWVKNHRPDCTVVERRIPNLLGHKGQIFARAWLVRSDWSPK